MDDTAIETPEAADIKGTAVEALGTVDAVGAVRDTVGVADIKGTAVETLVAVETLGMLDVECVTGGTPVAADTEGTGVNILAT